MKKRRFFHIVAVMLSSLASMAHGQTDKTADGAKKTKKSEMPSITADTAA